jgi:glutaredoxin
MKISIYTIPGCSYCTKVKELMVRADLEYEHFLVGTDLTREELIRSYPLAKGFPYVIIDGQPVGGLTQTAKYLMDKGLVKSRKKNG